MTKRMTLQQPARRMNEMIVTGQRYNLTRSTMSFLLLVVTTLLFSGRVEAHAPQLLGVNWNSGVVGLPPPVQPFGSEESPVTMSQPTLTAIRWEVCFDQRIQLNGASIDQLTQTPSTAHPGMGLTRLRCGHQLLESHPPVAWREMIEADQQAAASQSLAEDDDDAPASRSHTIPMSDQPTYMWPFFPHIIPPMLPTNIATLFSASVPPPPNCIWSVFVLGSTGGKVDIGGCKLAFLTDSQQDWLTPMNLTNNAGEVFTGEVTLPRGRDRKMKIFRGQDEVKADSKKGIQPSSSYVFSAESTNLVVKPANSLDDDLSYLPSTISKEAIKNGALDSETTVFLQSFETIRNMEEVSTKQVLEIIIEPVTMLCIPLMVNIATGIVSDIITGLIGDIVGPLLFDPLCKPSVAKMMPADAPPDPDPDPLDLSDPEEDGSAEGGEDAGDFLSGQGSDGAGYNTFFLDQHSQAVDLQKFGSYSFISHQEHTTPFDSSFLSTHIEQAESALEENSLAFQQRSIDNTHAAQHWSHLMHSMMESGAHTIATAMVIPDLTHPTATSDALIAYEGGVGGRPMVQAKTRRDRPATFPSFADLFARFDLDGTYTITHLEWRQEIQTICAFISLIHSKHFEHLLASVDSVALAKQIEKTYEFNGYPGTQLDEFMKDPDLLIHTLDELIVTLTTPSNAIVAADGEQPHAAHHAPRFFMKADEHAVLLDAIARYPQIFHDQLNAFRQNGYIAPKDLKQWMSAVVFGHGSRWSKRIPSAGVRQCVARTIPKALESLLPKRRRIPRLKGGGIFRVEAFWSLVQLKGSCLTDELLSKKWSMHRVVLELPSSSLPRKHRAKALDALATATPAFGQTRALHAITNWRHSSHGWKEEHLEYVFMTLDENGDGTISQDELSYFLKTLATSVALKREDANQGPNSLTLPTVIQNNMRSCLAYGAKRLTTLIFGTLDVNSQVGIQLSEFRVQPSLIHGAADILNSGCYLEILAGDPKARAMQRKIHETVEARKSRFMIPHGGVIPRKLLNALWREYNGGSTSTVGITIDIPRMERTLYVFERQSFTHSTDQSPARHRSLHACFLKALPWYMVQITRLADTDDFPGISWEEFEVSGKRVQGVIESLVRACVDAVDRNEAIDSSLNAKIKSIEPPTNLCSALSEQALEATFTSNFQQRIKDLELPEAILLPTLPVSLDGRINQLFYLFDTDSSDIISRGEMTVGFGRVVRGYQDQYCYPNQRTLYHILQCQLSKIGVVSESIMDQYTPKPERGLAPSVFRSRPSLIDTMAKKVIAECQTSLLEEKKVAERIWNKYLPAASRLAARNNRLRPADGAAPPSDSAPAAEDPRLTFPDVLQITSTHVIQESSLQLTPLQGRTRLNECILSILGGFTFEDYCLLQKVSEGSVPDHKGITKQQLSDQPYLLKNSVKLSLDQCVQTTSTARTNALNEFMSYVASQHKLTPDAFQLDQAPAQTGPTAVAASDWYSKIQISSASVTETLKAHVNTLIQKSTTPGYFSIGQCVLKKLNPSGVQTNVLDVWIRRSFQMDFLRRHLSLTGDANQVDTTKLVEYITAKQQSLFTRDTCPAKGQWTSLNLFSDEMCMDRTVIYSFPGVTLDVVNALPVGTPVNFEQIYSDLSIPMRYLKTLENGCASELKPELKKEEEKYVRYDLDKNGIITYPELVLVWKQDITEHRGRDQTVGGFYIYDWMLGLAPGLAHQVLTEIAGFPNTDVSRKLYDAHPDSIPKAFDAMKEAAKAATKELVVEAMVAWKQIARDASQFSGGELNGVVRNEIERIFKSDKFDATTLDKLKKSLDDEAIDKLSKSIFQHWTSSDSVTIKDFNREPFLLTQRVWEQMEAIIVPLDTRDKLHTSLFNTLDLNKDRQVCANDLASYYRTKRVELFKEKGYTYLSRCIDAQITSSVVPQVLISLVGSSDADAPVNALKFSFTQLGKNAARIQRGYERVLKICKANNRPAPAGPAIPSSPSKERADGMTTRLFKPLFPFVSPRQMHSLRQLFMDSPTYAGLLGQVRTKDGQMEAADASQYPNPSFSAALDAFDHLISQTSDLSKITKLVYSHYDGDKNGELSSPEFESYYLSLMSLMPHSELIAQWRCLLPHATTLSKNVIHQIKALGRKPPNPMEALTVGINPPLYRKSSAVMHESFNRVSISCANNKEMYSAFNFYDRNLDGSATMEELYFIYERLWLGRAESEWFARHTDTEKYHHAIKIHRAIGACIRKKIEPTLILSFKEMEFNGKQHIQIDEFAQQPTRWYTDAINLQKECEATATANYWSSLFWVYNLKKDGTLTKQEVTTYLQKQIASLDVNGLTKQSKETLRFISCLTRITTQAVNELFGRYDTNGQPGIQVDEFQHNPKMVVDTLKRMRHSCDSHIARSNLVTQFWRDWDQNHDGVIDQLELEAALRFALKDATKLSIKDAKEVQKCIDTNMAGVVHQIMTQLDTNGITGLQPEELDTEDQLAVVHRGGKAIMSACLPTAPEDRNAGKLKVSTVAHTHDVWLGLESNLQTWNYCPNFRMQLPAAEFPAVKGHESDAPVTVREVDIFYARYFQKAEESFSHNVQSQKWSETELPAVSSGHALYSTCLQANLPVLSQLLFSISSSGSCQLLSGETLFSYGLSLGQRCRRMVWNALSDLQMQREGEVALKARMSNLVFNAPDGNWWFKQCAHFSKNGGASCNTAGMKKLIQTLFQQTTVHPTNVYRTTYGPWLSMLPWTPSWLSSCVEERLDGLVSGLMQLDGIRRTDLTAEQFLTTNLPASILLGFGGVNLGCHRFFMALRGKTIAPPTKPPVIPPPSGSLEVLVTYDTSLISMFTLCHTSCPTTQQSMLELGSDDARLPDSVLVEMNEADENSLIEGGAKSTPQQLHSLHFASPFTSTSSNGLLQDGAFHLKQAESKSNSSPFFPMLLQPPAEFETSSIDSELNSIESEIHHPALLEVHSTLRDMEGSEVSAFLETDMFLQHSSMDRAMTRVQTKLNSPFIPAQPDKGYTMEGQADGGPVVNEMANQLSDTAAVQLTIALRVALEDNIMMQTNRTTSRKLSRQLTKRITIALTESVTRKLLGTLSRPISESTTRLLVHSLVPSLTFSLSAAISPSLTRTPHEDYYCWFCVNQQQYCAYCKASRANVYYADYYRNFYSFYYSHYYGQWYSMSNDIAQWIAEDKLDGAGDGGDE